MKSSGARSSYLAIVCQLIIEQSQSKTSPINQSYPLLQACLSDPANIIETHSLSSYLLIRVQFLQFLPETPHSTRLLAFQDNLRVILFPHPASKKLTKSTEDPFHYLFHRRIIFISESFPAHHHDRKFASRKLPVSDLPSQMYVCANIITLKHHILRYLHAGAKPSKQQQNLCRKHLGGWRFSESHFFAFLFGEWELILSSPRIVFWRYRALMPLGSN